MDKNSELLLKLAELIKHKKSKGYYAYKLGISKEEVNELLKKIKKPNTVEFKNETTKKVNNENGTLESYIELSFEPKSDLELATLHKIDLTKYKISSYWSKLKSNGKYTSSVFATLKKPKEYSLQDFTKFLENYKPNVKIDRDPKYSFDEVDIEISIADFHLGKKTLEGETLQDKKKHYLNVLTDLLFKAKKSHHVINKVIFPISNDYFHSDNYQNQTTNGTPQDVLTGFDKEYEFGFDLLVEAITILKEHSNEVNVILIQGNHDRTKSFYVAHALEVYFRANKDIIFQREHSTTKSVVLGNTFIGYHHGNCKIDELPLLFATGKDSENFGKSKYREVHTGDKHHYMAKEIKGVRIQQMPSLSGTDRWHEDNNFVNNIRAGLCFVYDLEKGKIAEFESRI